MADVVRYVARAILEDSGNEGLPVTWLCRELRAEGFKVQGNYAIASLLMRGSGFMLIEDMVYLGESTEPARREKWTKHRRLFTRTEREIRQFARRQAYLREKAIA